MASTSEPPPSSMLQMFIALQDLQKLTAQRISALDGMDIKINKLESDLYDSMMTSLVKLIINLQQPEQQEQPTN